MVAQVVGKYVVACIMQRLVRGKKVDFETAEPCPRFQMPRISIAGARHEVIANDEAVGIGRNKPALETDAVEGWEEHVFIGHSVFIRPPKNGRAYRLCEELGMVINNLSGFRFVHEEFAMADEAQQEL